MTYAAQVEREMRHWLDDQVLVRLKAERFDHLCALLSKACRPNETIEEAVMRLVKTRSLS